MTVRQHRLGDELASIFDPEKRPRAEPAPVVICVVCRQRVGAEDGTVRYVGERWEPVHRRCPEGSAA